MVNGIQIQLYSYKNATAYILNVQSFSPSNVTQFVADFQASMAEMNKSKDSRLIVNVAWNGGGYITLGYRMLAALCPHVQPRWGNYNIVEAPLNSFFVTSNASANTFSTQERFELDSMELFNGTNWYSDEMVEQFKTIFSGKYSFDLAYDETPESVYDSLLNTPQPTWLSKADNYKIAFVTDGNCGSTCACFLMRGAEANAGLFLQMGGNPDSQNLMSVASFAGGSVMTTQYTGQFDLSQYGV